MSTGRVYRHRPWRVSSSAGVLLLAGFTIPIWQHALFPFRIASIPIIFVGVTPIAALIAFLLLSLRIRTVVDDEAVTQHWISRSYRIPLDEITGIETDEGVGRWFLRLHCGERTFEVIPCPTVLWMLAQAIGPPRALLACRADIERSRQPVR